MKLFHVPVTFILLDFLTNILSNLSTELCFLLQITVSRSVPQANSLMAGWESHPFGGVLGMRFFGSHLSGNRQKGVPMWLSHSLCNSNWTYNCYMKPSTSIAVRVWLMPHGNSPVISWLSLLVKQPISSSPPLQMALVVSWERFGWGVQIKLGAERGTRFHACQNLFGLDSFSDSKSLGTSVLCTKFQYKCRHI